MVHLLICEAGGTSVRHARGKKVRARWWILTDRAVQFRRSSTRRRFDSLRMRYLVRARLKPNNESALLGALDTGTLGEGSVAGDEYLRNMQDARLCDDGTARWVEVCYCPTPLQEEQPYWEEFFSLERIQDAHLRRNCRDENGAEPWACGDCDCTARLEQRMKSWGQPFLSALRSESTAPPGVSPSP
jgi:hypothetical protein